MRSTELDMLGHVNNSVYQQWLEWGRFEWVRESGGDFSALASRNLTLVVVHVSLDYRREACLDNALVIETVLSRIGNRSLTYRQRVVHADGGVACDGTVVLAVFDKGARASAPLPDDERAKLAPFVDAFAPPSGG